MLIYFCFYTIYLWLFIDFETEWTHWLTLVAIPAGIIYIILKGTAAERIKRLVELIGLEPKHLLRGVIAGLAGGIVLGSAQLLLSRDRAIILESIADGRFFLALPFALGLMLVTAGFTEEFFFRGLLQSSLERRLQSRLWATIFTALAFGIYHFPYAYLKTSWPSHGNLGAAISEGILPTAVFGLMFGFVFARTRSLSAPIIMHALSNAVWAVKLFL